MNEFLLEFIKSNKDIAFIIVFLVAFIESLVLFGVFFPGWLLLFGVGGMIGADLLNFYPIMFAAYFGAVLGEYLSFILGYHYHQKILNWSFFQKQKKIIDYSHEFFKKHGAAGVFFGRFFGPTRAVVPFIAGLSEMPKRTFFWVNGLSGLLWAPVYLIPGILIGAAFSIETEQRNYLFFMLFLVATIYTVTVKLNRNYFKRIKSENDLLLGFKACISVFCSLLITVIFVLSPQWSLFTKIVSVVWQKIQ